MHGFSVFYAKYHTMKSLRYSFFFLLGLFVFENSFGQTFIQRVNFDDSLSGFTRDTLQLVDYWHICTPNKSSFSSAFNGQKAIMVDSTLPYAANIHTDFILEFELHGFDPTLTFEHRIISTEGKDGGYIDYSADGGLTWHLLIDTLENFGFLHELGSIGMYGVDDTLFNGVNGFSGNNGNWESVRLQFYCSAVKPNRWGTFHLRFNFISDSIQDELEGWMIDDIRVDGWGVCSSTQEIDLVDFKLYPNPASNLVHLSWEEGVGADEVIIYDSFGKKIQDYSISNSHVQIQTSFLDSGIYIICLMKDRQYLGRQLFIVE